MFLKRPLILYFFFLILQNVGNCINEQCNRSNRYCKGFNEVCSTELKKCKCKEGTQNFAGECLGISYYGDRCRKTTECSKSGDAHLHCINQVCRCGNERVYDESTTKCKENTDRHLSQRTQKEFHVNKMSSQDTSGSVVILDDKFKDIKNVG